MIPSQLQRWGIYPATLRFVVAILLGATNALLAALFAYVIVALPTETASALVGGALATACALTALWLFAEARAQYQTRPSEEVSD